METEKTEKTESVEQPVELPKQAEAEQAEAVELPKQTGQDDGISSPFLDDTVDKSPDKPVEPEKSYLDILKELYPNRISHMKSIIALYKHAFDMIVRKGLFNKTEKDVVEEAMAIKKFDFNISGLLDENKRMILQKIEEEVYFDDHVASIGKFLNASYIYYIWTYDNKAPIYKLPMTYPRFEIIMSAIHAERNELYLLFERCIKDPHMHEVRLTTPPFSMRNDMTKDKICEYIKENVLPVCKRLLELLLKLDGGIHEDIDITKEIKGTAEAPPSIARSDNLAVDEIIPDPVKFMQDLQHEHEHGDCCEVHEHEEKKE